MPTPINTGRPAPQPAQQQGQMAAPIMGVDWGAQHQQMESQVKAAYGRPSKSIFDEDATQNIPKIKISTGDYYWDIIPYLAGPRHPRVVMGLMDQGTPAYNVEIYVHKNLRQDLLQIICLARTFNLPCPICEYRNLRVQSGQASDDEIKSLYPATNPICGYNIWDRKEEQAGIKLFEISGFFFEKHLRIKAMMPKQLGRGIVVFQSPLAGEQGGRHITLKAQIGEKWDISAPEFHTRQQPIPDHILASAHILDELLYIPEYDDVAEIFFGTSRPADQDVVQQTQVEQPLQAVVQPGQPACPFGGEIGTMHGQYQECNNCNMFDVCRSMSPLAGQAVQQPQQVQQPEVMSQQPQVQQSTQWVTKPQAGPRPLRRPQG